MIVDPSGLSVLTGVRDGWNSFYPSGANYVLPLLSSLLVLNQICCLCSEDISVVQSRGKRVYSPLNQRFSFPSDCIYVRKIEIALDYICSLFKSFFLGEVLCEAWLMAL